MKKKKTFEETVRAMTRKQILQAMIDGLKKPAVAVDFGTYGTVLNDVCFGCAATNAICKIAGITFLPNEIIDSYNRAKAINSDIKFIKLFEMAINALRFGDARSYNRSANMIEIDCFTINEIGIYSDFPGLHNSNYKNDLEYYQDFCNSLPNTRNIEE